MHWRSWILLIAPPLAGCAMPMPYVAQKPPSSQAVIPIGDVDYVWDEVVDVIDDFFRIQQEERVKVIGNTLTEGRIDTFPETSATLLEPWRRDVATGYDRLESTLQTIRRRALVRVIPTQQGFLVDVAVFKELEDLPRPEQSVTGAATFRNEQSISRFNEPVGAQAVSLGWIPQGRDTALEQKIVCKLQARFGTNVGIPFLGPANCDVPPGEIPVPAGIPALRPESVPAPTMVEPPRQMLPPPGLQPAG